MSISLIYLFRRYNNRQGRFSMLLNRNADGAHIVQAPVITTIAPALQDIFICNGLYEPWPEVWRDLQSFQ
jgi:hypothetical protein